MTGSTTNTKTTPCKDKDNNLLGLSASLLAGEIASKDTTPLGPDDEVACSRNQSVRVAQII